MSIKYSISIVGSFMHWHRTFSRLYLTSIQKDSFFFLALLMTAKRRRGGKKLALAEICCGRSQVSWLWCILGVCRSWKSLEHVMAWHLPPAPRSPLQTCSWGKHSSITAPSVVFPSLPWRDSDPSAWDVKIEELARGLCGIRVMLSW